MLYYHDYKVVIDKVLTLLMNMVYMFNLKILMN